MCVCGPVYNEHRHTHTSSRMGIMSFRGQTCTYMHVRICKFDNILCARARVCSCLNLACKDDAGGGQCSVWLWVRWGGGVGSGAGC